MKGARWWGRSEGYIERGEIGWGGGWGEEEVEEGVGEGKMGE